jgi:hypothetical protein
MFCRINVIPISEQVDGERKQFVYICTLETKTDVLLSNSKPLIREHRRLAVLKQQLR